VRQPHLPNLAPLASPSEEQYQGTILELLCVTGWRAVHIRPLRTANGWRTPIQGPACAGWPDLFCVKETAEQGGRIRLLAAELKSAKVGSLMPRPSGCDCSPRLASNATYGSPVTTRSETSRRC
jgi:hypothetical protein